jgi:hypothetical protein
VSELEAYVFRTVFEPRTLLLEFSALVVQTAASETKPLMERALDEVNVVPVLWMHIVTHPEEGNKKGAFLQNTGPYLGLPLSFVKPLCRGRLNF